MRNNLLLAICSFCSIIYIMLKKLFLAVISFLPAIFAFKVYAADITPPVSTLTLDPGSPNGNNGWYVTPVTFTLSASDLESGVKTVNYKVDSGIWQTTTFSNTLNLATNPSFETFDPTSNIQTQGWNSLSPDTGAIYTRDSAIYLPQYATKSIKIDATGAGWHYIDNFASNVVTTPYNNMTASVWVKPQAVTQQAFFEVYAILGDNSQVLLSSSSAVTGTSDWVEISSNFTVTQPSAIGVFVRIGVTGTGTAWIDGVTITDSVTTASVDFVVGQDGSHTIQYYSTDQADNLETSSCTSPTINCRSMKIDQTPPGNWHNSGAFRGLFGASHELYVYTEVEDTTSGLSTFTDKYQYKVDTQESFGRYSNILSCSSTWQEGSWVILISPPFQPGVHSAYLLTPKTNFCNSNWKVCKTVRFRSEDMAGNIATKDFCINGPWIKLSGEGIVKSNNIIDMLSEPEEYNTDGLIETTGNLSNFFTSSANLRVTSAPPNTGVDYDNLLALAAQNPTEISNIVSTSGTYLIDGDYELKNSTIPGSYDDASFTQIVFINGDLLISNPIEISNASAALSIVNGNVNISKNVDLVGVAIFADGTINNAYDAQEGQTTNTLTWEGIFAANKFMLKRTLQGTNNANTPSDEFFYEPKYLVQVSGYFKGSKARWISVE